MSNGVSRRVVPQTSRAGVAPPAPRDVAPRRRRDKHGRGLRGALAPADIPLSKTRAERFDDFVRDAVERVERRWKTELARVEFAVEDIPSLDDWEHEWVPLARSYAGQGPLAPRVVVYRRPLETRALSHRDLRVLVHDVLVEEVAELLGVDPEQVDPGYVHPDDD